MFELYTESARRVMFFARYEASEKGSTAIGTEHLLLGLLRGGRGLVTHILSASNVAAESVRQEIDRRIAGREKIPTSVEIPFTTESQVALQYAAEEADRLGHNYIGPEHLLLALVRQEGSIAGSVLSGRGLRIDAAREAVIRTLADPATPGLRSRAEAAEHLDLLKQLVDQLAGTPANSAAARVLVQRIHFSLDRLRTMLSG